MMDLENYSTGGTIHIVVNNQIGFTTVPKDSRSGLYCTDIAKSIEAPIFHVNADDIESVVKVSRIAAEYRMKYKKDVFIDMVGYRRTGHNELDQPMFTQPLMYNIIKDHPDSLKIYIDQLLNDGVLTQLEIDQMNKDVFDSMEKSYLTSKDHKFKSEEWVTEEWEAIKMPSSYG
jgi:2-oxoglutarate dehydrogenase E1 component